MSSDTCHLTPSSELRMSRLFSVKCHFRGNELAHGEETCQTGSIKFTFESEKDSALPFLDMLVVKNLTVTWRWWCTESKPTRISIYILTLIIRSSINSVSSGHFLTEAGLSSQNKRIVSRNCSMFRQPFRLAVIQVEHGFSGKTAESQGCEASQENKESKTYKWCTGGCSVCKRAHRGN